MRAVVDTGSCYTLIKEATANKMGNEINKRHALPNLQGVTGSPLRILGMIWLEIGVGEDHVHKQWFPVVPNSYLDADLLLGTAVLSRAPFTWDGNKNIIVWGNSSYVISHIRRQRGKVERVRAIPLTLNQSDQVKDIRLTKYIRMEPYQTQFLPIPVPKNPEETLLVQAQSKIPTACHSSPKLMTATISTYLS